MSVVEVINQDHVLRRLWSKSIQNLNVLRIASIDVNSTQMRCGMMTLVITKQNLYNVLPEVCDSLVDDDLVGMTTSEIFHTNFRTVLPSEISQIINKPVFSITTQSHELCFNIIDALHPNAPHINNMIGTVFAVVDHLVLIKMNSNFIVKTYNVQDEQSLKDKAIEKAFPMVDPALLKFPPISEFIKNKIAFTRYQNGDCWYQHPRPEDCAPWLPRDLISKEKIDPDEKARYVVYQM